MAEPEDLDVDLGSAYVGEAATDEDTPEDVFTEPEVDTARDEVKPTPARHGKRESTAQLVTMLWGAAGMALIRTEVDIPVGRVLQLQAPLAGSKIDDLIAHTWLDSVLQPFVAQANKLEGLGALITLPALVAVYERSDDLGPVIEPLLREVVSSTLIDMAPVLREKRTKQRASAKTIEDITQALGLKKGDDPILAVLNTIFAPPPGKDDHATVTEE